jgi:hypothetical protein
MTMTPRPRTRPVTSGGPSPSQGPSTKQQAGIAVAVITAVGVIVAALLNSGAYADLCPASLCGETGNEALPSAAPSTASSRQASQQSPGHSSGGSWSRPGGSGSGSGSSVKGKGGSVSQSPKPAVVDAAEPVGDFDLRLSTDTGCAVRTGPDGYWDVNVWWAVTWSSEQGRAMPGGHLRIKTDTDRSRDWGLAQVGYGGSLDTFVVGDSGYLGRYLKLTATVQPDHDIEEAGTSNNMVTLRVDLRGGLPPADTTLPVPCTVD